MNKILSVLLTALLINACTSTEQHPVPETRDGDAAEVLNLPHRTASESSSVQVLLDRANAQIGNSQPRAALATLERALRIAPRDASIYLAMVVIYQDMGEGTLALNTARRGLLYCDRGASCQKLRQIAGQ